VAHSLRSRCDRNDIGPSLDPVKVIGPLLHHLAALADELCPVVRRAEAIRYSVRELKLDHFRFVFQFLMQDRARHRPETVAGYLGAGIVAKPPKRSI